MPHLVLRSTVDLDNVATRLDLGVLRWGRAVLKTGDVWLRADKAALLVEGVVVELARPLHPVALVSHRDGDTVVRLWSVVDVERTSAVQRWLGVVAGGLQGLGCGAVRTTNIGGDVLDGLGLVLDQD